MLLCHNFSRGISTLAPVAGFRPMRRFTLLHHQLRDPREHELSAPQQLLLGQPAAARRRTRRPLHA